MLAYLASEIDGLDVDAKADGWPAAFRAYAAACRNSASEYRALVALLESEAGLFDLLAQVAEARAAAGAARDAEAAEASG
jgi:hypothetical protein